MSDEHERERKSWREIDRLRDHSRHTATSTERERARSGRGQPSTQGYRATLDRLFETGQVGKLMEKAGLAPIAGAQAGKARLAGLARIRDAIGRDEITGAVDEYLAQYTWPDDTEVLGQALEHRNHDVVRDVLGRLDVLLGREQPRRSRSLAARLAALAETASDPEIRELAVRVRRRLP
jgi:hypothetical protein